jgi:hypothetical protein
LLQEEIMRIYLGLAAAALLAAAPARADERADALAVIDKAVEAHGGEKALTKAQAVVRRATGLMAILDKDVPFADELTAQLPDRFRLDLEAGQGGQKVRVLLVFNGAKGWQSTGGAVSELAPERLKELREDGYARWLTTLVPLKQEGIVLAPLPEVKVNDRPAVGVKASRKGFNDVKLYFDRETHLLVRTERRVGEGGVPLVREEIYGGHRAFDGVKMPTSVVQYDVGKKVLEITTASYRFPERIDESRFNRP